MMAKKPEDRPASMTEVIALLQASKLSTDSDMGTVAPPLTPTSAAEVCKQPPLQEGGRPRPVIDSAIFARRIESEEMAIDSKLNLWDLLMDVRLDDGVAGERGADQDEREGEGEGDHELNLRELAMALGRRPLHPPRGSLPSPTPRRRKGPDHRRRKRSRPPRRNHRRAIDNRYDRPHQLAKKKRRRPGRNRLLPPPRRRKGLPYRGRKRSRPACRNRLLPTPSH